jgi:very-short-patch-repair endonuclease
MKTNPNAHQLRQNSTDAEKRLWAAFRGRQFEGFKFRRQHPIGFFIADFACIEHKLIIEADGGQHADNDNDIIRTVWLEKQGWRVLRFWNTDILANTSGVLETILKALEN